MAKPRLATIWLDGCSGCHMSFLDLDERLFDVFARAELVYGPLVDAKEFPEDVDVTLVEGAVSTEDDLRRVREVRAKTKILVSLGDCAVTANVPGMRNPLGPKAILETAYASGVTGASAAPSEWVPALLERVQPVHAVVPVDVYLPGCPPSADVIAEAIDQLLAGQLPDTAHLASFG
ncbi:MAG: NADP oxidoreductase [Actinomycetota bacterium]|nr:NADP oxidoreductase [Actinomycetota bacterium]